MKNSPFGADIFASNRFCIWLTFFFCKLFLNIWKFIKMLSYMENSEQKKSKQMFILYVVINFLLAVPRSKSVPSQISLPNTHQHWHSSNMCIWYRKLLVTTFEVLLWHYNYIFYMIMYLCRHNNTFIKFVQCSLWYIVLLESHTEYAYYDNRIWESNYLSFFCCLLALPHIEMLEHLQQYWL